MCRQIIIVLLLFISRLLCSQTFSKQECDLLLEQLPGNFKKGSIIYPQNDSIIFVFKALDYMKISKFDSIPQIRSDSTDEANYRNLCTTFKRAKNETCTVLRETKYKETRMFPNHYILKMLFSSHDIIILKYNYGTYKKIDYRAKKKRGKYKQWEFSVIQRDNKAILFKTAYGTSYN